MKPVSGTMLALAALLTSPALAGVAAGTMPLDVALARYLVVAGVCWVLLTLAAEWLWSEPAVSPVTTDVPAPGPDGAPDGS